MMGQHRAAAFLHVDAKAREMCGCDRQMFGFNCTEPPCDYTGQHRA